MCYWLWDKKEIKYIFEIFSDFSTYLWLMNQQQNYKKKDNIWNVEETVEKYIVWYDKCRKIRKIQADNVKYYIRIFIPENINE